MTKVYAPNKNYNGVSATVHFVNGVGETDNQSLLRWFESRGYKVEGEAKAKPSAKAPAKSKAPAKGKAPAKKAEETTPPAEETPEE